MASVAKSLIGIRILLRNKCIEWIENCCLYLVTDDLDFIRHFVREQSMTQVFENVASCRTDNTQLIVAFASLEGDMVDQHFGSSQGFFVYAIQADNAQLLTSKIFPREAKDGNEDKLKPKLTWLVGSDIVYCGSIGGSATRQLISLGIAPQKVTGGPDVEELIEDLQSQLSGTPDFWLANILKQKQKTSSDTSRFAEEEDSWD